LKLNEEEFVPEPNPLKELLPPFCCVEGKFVWGKL
jgi:hypothetical protein